MEKYLKYYFLEDYLFKEVSENFRVNKCLTAEEFFAIVIWKRNASKTKIKDSLITSKQVVEGIGGITGKVYMNRNNRKRQVELLRGVEQIGISIASAILAVCYPKDFTIVDYRVCNSLSKEPFMDDPILKEKFPNGVSYTAVSSNVDTYLMYVDTCKEIAPKYGFKTVRDFDRMLFGMDFYDGKDGLLDLVGKYERKELEKENLNR